jgi:hypothetical protein
MRNTCLIQDYSLQKCYHLNKNLLIPSAGQENQFISLSEERAIRTLQNLPVKRQGIALQKIANLKFGSSRSPDKKYTVSCGI